MTTKTNLLLIDLYKDSSIIPNTGLLFDASGCRSKNGFKSYELAFEKLQDQIEACVDSIVVESCLCLELFKSHEYTLIETRQQSNKITFVFDSNGNKFEHTKRMYFIEQIVNS